MGLHFIYLWHEMNLINIHPSKALLLTWISYIKNLIQQKLLSKEIIMQYFCKIKANYINCVDFQLLFIKITINFITFFSHLYVTTSIYD
jgi:hypothetical protein